MSTASTTSGPSPGAPIANEWAARGVNVNVIAPGYIRTTNTAALQKDPTRSRQILERIPAGRWGTVEIRPVMEIPGLPAA